MLLNASFQMATPTASGHRLIVFLISRLIVFFLKKIVLKLHQFLVSLLLCCEYNDNFSEGLTLPLPPVVEAG